MKKLTGDDNCWRHCRNFRYNHRCVSLCTDRRMDGHNCRDIRA